MARKGWDALTDAYRRRLQRGGVSQSAYESGSSLSKARGHISTEHERFTKRASRFVRTFGTPADSPDVEFSRIMELGSERGQSYMDYRRKMTRLYESGRYRQAETMYKQRDKSIPDSQWWYHGMFSG